MSGTTERGEHDSGRIEGGVTTRRQRGHAPKAGGGARRFFRDGMESSLSIEYVAPSFPANSGKFEKEASFPRM